MNYDRLLQLSDILRGFTERVGKFGSWFILPLVFVTMWDVIFRKVGHVQVWMIENLGRGFGSTVIQELEWHFHTALFVLVLGYGYIYNRHVRVDIIREKLTFRTQAMIEFLGCTFFLIPYCAIVTYFAAFYTYESWALGEVSASTVGLSFRWIIKSVMVVGLFVSAVAGVAVWLQTVVVLLAPTSKRFPLMTLEWPEEQARKVRLYSDAKAARAAEIAASKPAPKT